MRRMALFFASLCTIVAAAAAQPKTLVPEPFCDRYKIEATKFNLDRSISLRFFLEQHSPGTFKMGAETYFTHHYENSDGDGYVFMTDEGTPERVVVVKRFGDINLSAHDSLVINELGLSFTTPKQVSNVYDEIFNYEDSVAVNPEHAEGDSLRKTFLDPRSRDFFTGFLYVLEKIRQTEEMLANGNGDVSGTKERFYFSLPVHIHYLGGEYLFTAFVKKEKDECTIEGDLNRVEVINPAPGKIREDKPNMGSINGVRIHLDEGYRVKRIRLDTDYPAINPYAKRLGPDGKPED